MNTRSNKIRFTFKSLLATVLAVITLLSMTFLFSCGVKNKEENDVSKLRGTFTFSQTYGQDKSLTITTNPELAASEFKYQYLLVSGWPQRQIADNTGYNCVSYAIDQRLKLSKDFTYYYEYSIKLANPLDWGGTVANITVSMGGTFTYLENEDSTKKDFTVKLSNPTSGTHTVYSARLNNASSIYNWNIHGEPDLVEDLGYLATLPDNNFDKYTCGRTVKVRNETDNKVLTDDIFFVDILQDLGKYFNY